MQIYPDSLVIVSVRDSDEQWWKSYFEIFGAYYDDTLKALLLYLLVCPVWEFYKTSHMADAYIAGWKSRYGCFTKGIHRIHTAQVQRTIPSDRLLIFNVKQGWDPLCKFLGVPIPDEPFPQVYVY